MDTVKKQNGHGDTLLWAAVGLLNIQRETAALKIEPPFRIGVLMGLLYDGFFLLPSCSIFGRVCFIVLCPPSDGGSVILIASACGFHVGGQLGYESVQPVGKLPMQLGVFGISQENILIPPVCGGRFALSTHVVLIQVAATQVVRGQFSFSMKDGFLSVVWKNFCPSGGSFT